MLDVTVTPFFIENLLATEQKWKALTEKSQSNIFTSWQWISTWLEYIKYQAELVSVVDNNEVVGLGFICKYKAKKYGVCSKQIWLNRTGDVSKDQVWNEYNDLLCIKGREWAIRSAVLSYFEQHQLNSEEFLIGVSGKEIEETPRSNKIHPYISWKTTSYLTHLKPEYKDKDIFLSTISKNTRSQIKRTEKLYQKQGDITLVSAASVTEALDFFEQAGQLHKIRWENKNSGFENPNFIAFHTAFIKQNFDAGFIDLLAIKVGQVTICYLYNFIYDKTAYFYLSGIKYEEYNGYKPGLLAHTMAIAYYASKGMHIYDFMGGEGRYKRSLSNESSKMIIASFRRNSIKHQLSGCVHKIKYFLNLNNK